MRAERKKNLMIAGGVTQTISGSFDSPRAGTVSAVESLAGPIFDLYRKTRRFVQAGKCEVFYNGAVQQPH